MITHKEIQKLSNLCKIEFTDSEVQYIFDDLNETLDNFKKSSNSFYSFYKLQKNIDNNRKDKNI